MLESANYFEGSVRVFGKTYSISKLSDSVGDNEFGQANYLTQTIAYNPRLGHDEVRDTLLHEILHCVDHAIQTNLSESQVHALASGVYALIKDNPQFFEWVVSDV